MKRFLAVFLILLMLSSALPIYSAADSISDIAVQNEGSPEQLSVTGLRNYDLAFQVLSILNEEREKIGLKRLVMDEHLMQCAMIRSAEITVSFSHTRPDGTLCTTISPFLSGENIAMGQRSATHVMTSWMNSPGHRENILREDYSTVGIGCFIYNGNYYWAQNFGRDNFTENCAKPANATVTEKIRLTPETKTYPDYFIVTNPTALTLTRDETHFISARLGVNTEEGPVYYLADFTFASKNSNIAACEGASVRGADVGKTVITVSWGKVSADIPVTVVNKTFSDIKAGAWYHDAVYYVVDKGLFSGTGKTTFSPDTNMSRAMLVQVLYRMEGSAPVTFKNIFSDVKSGRWYSDAVIWAAENDIVKGTGDGRFDPDGLITREQLALILYNYSIKKGKDVSALNTLAKFPDASDTSSWARTAVEWAVGSGLISGTGAGRLEPKGKASRAQVAVILMNYLTKSDVPSNENGVDASEL